MHTIKHFFILMLFGFIAVTARSQTIETKQRSLDGYDKIIIDVNVSKSPRPAIIKIQDFVWEHWKKKSLCYAEMTVRSKEGEPTTYQIFIEPDELGVWRLAMLIKSERYDRRVLSDPKRTFKPIIQTQSYEAYIVERVKSKENDVLKLKDKSGKVISEL